MEIPPQVAAAAAHQQNQQHQQQQQHVNQTPHSTVSTASPQPTMHVSGNNNNNNNNNNNYFQTNDPQIQNISNNLHPVVDELRRELHHLKLRLNHAEEEKNTAIVQAKSETYLHIVRVLRQEGVAGVERLKSVYGGDAAAVALRQGGGALMLGGGHQRATHHVAAPSVSNDHLTREELHSGLRKALRLL